MEPFSSGLLSLWLNVVGTNLPVEAIDLSTLWNTPTLVAGNPDPAVQAMLQKYLVGLQTKGFSATTQGVWIQAGRTLLAGNQGTVPLPAASLTKVATSLAALETWGPDHQFETLISTTGPIQNGVLMGDLVIQGSGDPLFVWEEAIALGNALNQLGIRRVSGNLLITGKFYMNYEANPVVAGTFLKQALDFSAWNPEINAQYYTFPAGTRKPQVQISGAVLVPQLPVPKQILLIRHRSLPLVQILKLMNIYSNNPMAEMLAEAVGGAKIVAQRAAQAAGVPAQEIQLINGSGLGPENRISPRAVCGMFMAIHRSLNPTLPLVKENPYTIADFFPVMGRDEGTLLDRKMPGSAVVKTGTLWDVSTLAGVLPTRDQGLVWFAILNRGDNVDDFRQKQDVLLQALVQQWGTATTLPIAITPKTATGIGQNRLGASERNTLVYPGATPANSSSQTDPTRSGAIDVGG